MLLRKKKLCGKFRPGHFEAVVDVIDRFIKIIKPSQNIHFGRKGYATIENHRRILFKEKNTNQKLFSCKTIREKNGIACSSRNYLLSLNEKINCL